MRAGHFLGSGLLTHPWVKSHSRVHLTKPLTEVNETCLKKLYDDQVLSFHVVTLT